MKHLSVRLLVVAGAICVCLATFAGTASATASSTRIAQIEEIDALRTETWRWQSLMRKPRTPTAFTERRTSDASYLRWVRNLWQRAPRAPSARPSTRRTAPSGSASTATSATRARAGARAPATATTAACRWTSTSSATYGRELLRRKGTANKWTPVEQMWVAERAYRSGRGFYPWPNTARYCGLI